MSYYGKQEEKDFQERKQRIKDQNDCTLAQQPNELSCSNGCGKTQVRGDWVVEWICRWIRF